MAKPSLPTDGLKDMIECSICDNEYSDPRILPCIHTFCLQCLTFVGHNKQPGEMMSCPLCRAEFRIPDDGIEGIQKNFFMTKLMDIHRSSISDLNTNVCDACSEDDGMLDTTPLAIVVCIDCNQKLCDLCCQWHKKTKALKQHQLVDLKDRDVISQLSKNLSHGFCIEHGNKPIEMYCLDCKTTSCIVCHVEGHQGHKCSIVSKIGEEFRIHMEKTAKRILDCLDFSKNDIINKLDEKNQIILENIEMARTGVLRQENRIKEIVEAHTMKLLQEIDTIKEEKQRAIETDKEEVNRHITVLESYERYANEIKEKGSAADICRTYHDMSIRAEELQKDHTSITDSIFNCSTAGLISFIPSDFEDLLIGSTEDVIGCLKSDEEEEDYEVPTKRLKSSVDAVSSAGSSIQPDEKSEPITVKTEENLVLSIKQEPTSEETTKSFYDSKDFCQATVSQITKRKQGLVGMTWMENKLYVICGGSKRILVFSDQNPFERYEQVEEIQIDDINFPYDMTASSKVHHSLFISDWNNLFRVKMPGNEIRRKRVDGKPCNLSTTSSGDLLVVVARGNPQCYYLDVYDMSSHGFNRTKSIILSSDIEKLSNVVQASNGNFIFSYQNRTHSVPSVHRINEISELSSDGTKIIRTFTPSKLDALTLTDWSPIYLSMDESDNVFIAECSSVSSQSPTGTGCSQYRQRISAMNSLWTEIKILSDGGQHQIDELQRIFYLREKKQLIAGHSKLLSYNDYQVTLSVFNLHLSR